MSNSGKTTLRADGPAKVTGLASFAGDHNLAGQLYAVLVTSTIAAGRIASIDATAANAVPEVVRVLTPADMPRVHPALEKITVPPLASRFMPMQSDLIVHEGQPIAVVLAESLEAAEEGAAKVRVAYNIGAFQAPDNSLPSIADPRKGDYSKSSALEFQKGSPKDALRIASVSSRRTYSQPSRHANPMEPSATLAVWEGDALTLYDAVQHLPAVQNALAAVFGIDPALVRIISPHTGGGFGAKAFIWPHEILSAMAARVTRRPVKLVLTRQQMYGMVGPQPAIEQEIHLAADDLGKLQAVVHVATNVTGITDDYVEFAAIPGRSFYACDNILTSQRVRRGNMTLPTFMRSPWDGPGSWALESAMDELSRALRLDPLELRMLNYAEDDPESGAPWSSKKLREAYTLGAQRFGWSQRPKGGSRDGHWLIGCGMADCSQGQARFHSTARVKLLSDGSAILESSFCDIGTGPATIFPMVAAEILGLTPEKVVAKAGDTKYPYAGPTYGSGTTLSTGAAVKQAAEGVRAKLAKLLGWDPQEVEMRDGHIVRRSDSRSIRDVMADAGVGELVADGAFNLPGGAPVDMGAPGAPVRSFGVIFVQVAVDPALGLLRLRRATGVYSAGHIVNPLTAKSQMIGGIVWGWGMAAMEASHFEPNLGRWLSKDLAGVPLPVNADIPPEIDVSFVEEFDAKAGPLGARGIGELGATGVAAAVANAVFDATGIRVRELPITPDKLLLTA